MNATAAGGAPDYRVVRALGRVLRNADGDADAVIGVYHDVTDDTEIVVTKQRSAELGEALDLAQAQFVTLFDESTDCLAYLMPDANDRLVHAALNRAGLAHVPCSWEEARGRAPEDVLDGDGGATIQANIQRVFTTGSSTAKLYEQTSVIVTTNLAFAKVAKRLRRRQNDHRAARPSHPPLRHRRDR